MSDGKYLECADEHIVIDSHGREVFVKDLKSTDKVKTIDGYAFVNKVTKVGNSEVMYDIQLNDNGHVYYTNGIFSHNTTSYAVAVLHMCLFNLDKKVLILANKGDIALEIMSRIRLAYELLPAWIKPGVTVWNKRSIEFSNGCRIEGSNTSADSARGKSVNVLVIDEAAFIDAGIADELWSSVYPIISSSKNSKVIMVSTPNGTGNLFHRTFSEAESNRSKDGWTPFKFLWSDVPGRDEEWKEQQLASFNYDYAKFNQEFGCEFLGSTNILIPPEWIRKAKIAIVDLAKSKPQYRVIDYGNDMKVTIYEESVDGHCYVIGGDAADGVGGDASVMIVFDITDPRHVKEVAYFSSNMVSPNVFSTILAQTGMKYNMAPIMMESNGIGGSIINLLYEIYEYGNIPTIGGKKMGITSGGQLKIDACSNIRSYFTTDAFIDIKTSKVIEEMETFEKYSTKYGMSYKACRGNDDAMMSVIWAFFLLNSNVLVNYYDCHFEGVNVIPKFIRHFDDNYKIDRDNVKKQIESSSSVLRVDDIVKRGEVGPVTSDDYDYEGFAQMYERFGGGSGNSW